MNVPLLARPIAVRVADIRDSREAGRIDGFVHEHPGGTPFHRPVWSAAVARGCRQRSHYLVAESGAGALIGVLPLTELHSPLFGRALTSAGFAVDGGILAESDSARNALAAAAWSLSQRLSCPTLELRGGPRPAAEWEEDSATYRGFCRPLAADDEAELAAIPRKQRAEVRRSLGLDLEVSVGRDAAALAGHYAVYAESVRNLGTPVFPRRLFAEVVEAFGTDADVLTVRCKGSAVASVLSLYFNGTVYPYWGGGTAAARTLRANDRMYFALMSHARSRGCTRFDFGRSKSGTGAAAFKKNWGFEPRPLTYWSRASDGAAKREVNPLSPRYRLQVRIWSRLPLTVANRVGPWIARGLG